MHIHHHYNQLFVEKISATELAERYGTPCYVYSRAALEEQWQAFNKALKNHPHQICYAVKANSNLAILNIFARLGSGFDIVSGGELARVLAAGGAADKIIFSGVGKQNWEIKRALEVGVYCFNVESTNELDRINSIAEQMGKRAPIALRINPDIDAGTHPYISTGLSQNKFGIAIEQALATYEYAAGLKNLAILGIGCHIGSQLTEVAPFLSALDRLLELIATLQKRGIEFKHIDIGGGLGVRYRDEQPPTPTEYCAQVLHHLRHHQLKLILEPGRALVANAGILLTRLEYIKKTAVKNFAIVDAAMNDLLRPALYSAWQDIVPVIKHQDIPFEPYDVVGPVCETGDFLGKDRDLAIKEGDLLAILSAGAYGFAMSSNYNTRPRAAEVLVDGDKSFVVRKRETIEELFASELSDKLSRVD